MSNTSLDYNDILRSGVIGLVAKINIEGLPVGGALSFIIGLLWSESDKSEANWNSIKRYAEKMVNQAIDKERTEALNRRLEGFRNIAEYYSKTSFESDQKGQYLTSLMSALLLFEPDFWDERNPEKMFPLFTTFGTLWLTALAEQAYKYKDIYHKEHKDHALHLQMFHENVAKYSQAAQKMYDRLLEWRFRQMELTEWQSHDITQSSSEWKFTDKYDNGVDPIFSQRSSGSDWGHSYHNPSGRRAMESVQRDRVAHVQSGFVEDLQSILSTAQLWQYLDPLAPRPLSFHKVSEEGPWGNLINRGTRFDDRPSSSGSRITHIKIRHNAVVECLEIFYDGKSLGAHGNPSGGTLTEMELLPDEFITEVSGRVGDFIDRIEFKTNKGRTVAGGGDGGSPFLSKGHASWAGVSLFAVSGWNDDRRLTGLQLHWKHVTDMVDYVPTYKRTEKALTLFSNVVLKGETTSKDQPNFIASLVTEYSGRAAANEYFPKSGPSAVVLQLHSAKDKAGPSGQTISGGAQVRIWTSEATAKDYPYLGKYASYACYYYSPSGEARQLWELIKVIPSDGPVVADEKVYLRNAEECNYLFPTDDGYIGSRVEPYAWSIEPR